MGLVVVGLELRMVSLWCTRSFQAHVVMVMLSLFPCSAVAASANLEQYDSVSAVVERERNMVHVESECVWHIKTNQLKMFSNWGISFLGISYVQKFDMWFLLGAF